jgi:triacylglycerol lipase
MPISAIMSAVQQAAPAVVKEASRAAAAVEQVVSTAAKAPALERVASTAAKAAADGARALGGPQTGSVATTIAEGAAVVAPKLFSSSVTGVPNAPAASGIPTAPTGGTGAAPAAGGPVTRDPVVLVHGLNRDSAAMDGYAAAMRRDGYDVTVVSLPGRATGDISASSAALAGEVEAVKKRTGAKKVDIVGHSEGGLVARDYVENRGGASSVDSVVTVGTPHNGIGSAPLNDGLQATSFLGGAIPVAVTQMLMGSSFLAGVNGQDGKLDPGVKYTSVYNGAGDGVVAADSSRLAGARNVALPDSIGRTHDGLLHDDAAYGAVVTSL